ncbi:ABC transporter permease [Thermodesulfobacteriota bacterium]
MNIGKMAWRNLFRSKRRTFITALSIGFGVLLSVTFTGMAHHSYTNMIDTSATMGFGHLTVQPRGYLDTPSLDKRLLNAEKTRKEILEKKGIKDAVVRIIGQAMIASANKSVGGIFLGIDPSQEAIERNLFIKSITEGQIFKSNEDRGALIGSLLAKKLNLRLNKKFVYTTTDVSGEIVSELARVKAIFETGVDEVDGSTILLPINSVRKTLSYDKGDATLIAVLIDDQRHAEKYRDIIETGLDDPGAEALTWKETQPELAGIITIDKAGNYIIQVLIGLLIAAGILNTLLMSVMERTKEFGVMMAVGMSPSTLFRLVIIESLWLAIIGIILGVIITSPWYAYLYQVGLDFSGMIGDDYSASGVLVDPVMRILLYKESAVAIILGVFALTLVSGLYPAWRAGRVPPIESLKTI